MRREMLGFDDVPGSVKNFLDVTLLVDVISKGDRVNSSGNELVVLFNQ